jgi:hypothetical protein
MTRNGKIARLPTDIRDELNQRLENGEEASTLLPWLNALPEVQTILKENFDGAPITKQNLSEWRQGGFREWQIRRELIVQARHLSDSAEEMDEYVDIPLLAGNLAALLAARYAALLNTWDGEPDPKFEDKLRLLRGLNRDIALLQKTMHQASRQKREFDKAVEENEKRIEKEVKDEVLAPIFAKVQSDAMAAVLGGGEWGRKMADIMAAVKYNLPPPKPKEEGGKQKEERTSNQAKTKPRNKPQSNPVAPSRPSQIQSPQSHCSHDSPHSHSVAPSPTQAISTKTSENERVPLNPAQPP